jgi:hypothetical protein
MKGNYATMTDLATEIERIEKSKNDYLVNHGSIGMTPDDNTLELFGIGNYRMTDIAHQQVSEKLGIPKRYYEAMGTIPGLRAQNVNAWLRNSPDTRKMVRTLDGRARAFLSDKFVPFDHFTVMESFLPVMRDFANVEVRALSLTDTKMYVQLVFPTLAAEIKKGDIVQAGITLSNSEVGYGAVDISTLIWRLVCSNGMIGQSLVNRVHVGRRISDDVQESNIFKHDTIVAEIEAFRLRLRDTFANALTQTTFEKQVVKLRAAAEDKITNLIRVVENVTRRFEFTEKERESIMTNLMTEGDASRWGLANSITALAKEIDNQDRQFTLEQKGNEVIELSPHDWKVMNEETLS